METLQRTANRGSISTGYDIDNSLKFETDNTEYLERATGGGNGSQQKHTISVWVKRTELSNGTNTYIMGFNGGRLRFETNDIIEYQFRSGRKLETNRKFRDTSAWYHIVVVADSSLATSTDRMKLYINGVRETDLLTYIPQDQNQGSPLWGVYNTYNFRVGGAGSYSSDGINGYLAEVYYINGQTLDPTDFGEFDDDSGIWKPKAFTGTLGSLDNYLDFSNSSNLGEDANGGTDLSLNNITSADQATDTPTNNFCTLNPIVNFKYTTNGITEGATVFGDNTGGGVGGAFGTMAVTKGKWYWEVKLTQQSSHYIGISAVDDGDNVTSSSDPHQINSSFVFNILNARIEYINGGTVTAGSLDAFTDFHSVGDVISIALNMDDNEISMYGNGTLQSGVANTSIYDAADKMVVPLHGTINDECQYNFGGYSAWTPSSAASDANGYGTFEYAPPTGYYALCTKNLAEEG
jgi:hypothetical protein